MAHIVKRYSYEEIAKHTAENDCWIVVNGYVYDVSHFLKNHPGGSQYILQVAGKPEAMNEFNKSGQHIHSKNAWEILRKFRLGATVDKKQEDIDRFVHWMPCAAASVLLTREFQGFGR
jgi:4-hydroxysphinganine ceramide fatty acyl 2-hydroxylase